MASTRPEAIRAAPVTAVSRAKPLYVERDERQELSNLLAHDLKTPLAAIAMNLDFALSELGSADQSVVRSALEDCKVANARAVRLVSDMADALRLASGERRPSLKDVPVTKVIEALASRLSSEAAARGVRILWASDGQTMRADRDLLERVLERLVERAVRHASGSCVVVDHRATTITLRTETSGDGADPNGRALATAFAEAVIHAHGGRFTIETADGALVYRIHLER